MDKLLYKKNNILIPLLISFSTGIVYAVFGVSATILSLKWILFLIIAITILCVLTIVPGKKRILLFFLFFSLPIGINYNMFFDPPDYFRPVNGIVFSGYDTIAALLLGIVLYHRLFHNQKIRIPRKYGILWGACIPFVIIGIISCRYTNAVKIGILFEFLKCGLIFIVVYNVIHSKHDLEYALMGIMGSIISQAVLGLMQKITGSSLGLEFLGQSSGTYFAMKAGSGIVNRIAGTMGHSNKLASYLGLVLPIAAALFFVPTSRFKKRCFILPALCLGGVVELFTYSRGGWFGLCIGGSLTVYICLVSKTRRSVISFIILIFTMVMVSTTVILTSKQARMRLFETDYGSGEIRKPLMQVACAIVAAHPVSGAGLGNYTAVFHSYDHTRNAVTYSFPKPVHNEYLLIAAELGIIVLIGFLILFGTLGRSLIRTIKYVDHTVVHFSAIGLIGGITAWAVHMTVEFAYFFLNVPIWALLGLVPSLEFLTLQKSEVKDIGI